MDSTYLSVELIGRERVWVNGKRDRDRGGKTEGRCV